MSHNGCEYVGKIPFIRAVEDSIRATKKYTEGVRTMRAKHPIQGEEFPSRVFCKYYEVYPDVDVSHMSLGTIVEWLSGYKEHIDVMFKYDYRVNKASILIEDGASAVMALAKGIPKFSDTLAEVIEGETKVITSESGKTNQE